jgi:Fic family protein
MFDPTYTIKPKLATILMQIAAIKEDIEHMSLSPSILEQLRVAARIRSVHYSTQIAGNRLTLEQVEEIIKRSGAFQCDKAISSDLRILDAHQRALMSLFAHQEYITTKEIATFFKLKPRTARYLCQQLVATGFLTVADASKKKRTYTLASRYKN